jgi:hypothetical protein
MENPLLPIQVASKFDDELDFKWGLSSLVKIGENWLPSLLDQVGKCECMLARK